MIIPYLYATYADLKSGGGSYKLPDVVSICVTEERNGAFDLEMAYLYHGENAAQIVCEAFIMAVPQRGQAEEPFRIYEITTPINGIIAVKAHHISYDLDGAVLQPFNKTGLANILSEINTQLSTLGFDFSIVNNGITVSHQFSISYPQSASSVLGKGNHCLISDFSAEVSYSWDAINGKEVVTLNAQRGATSTATIAYGFNLLELDSFVNSDAVYSAIYPYYIKSENGGTTLVTLTEHTVSTGAITTRTRVLPVDLTSVFSSVPTEGELRTAAQAYVAAKDWNSLESCSVDFVPLQNTTEYEHNIDEQSLGLCDTVVVSAEIIGVETTAKVVKTVYNQMTEKYDSMTVGTILPNIADTIASMR
jgi:phage minor structural protein